MSFDTFDVVDLGTKHGDAIVQFFQRAGKSVLPQKEIAAFKPNRCIGYERKEAAKYRQIVESKGYQFDFANLADSADLTTLPTAQVYLAWHVLEHLPDKSCADRVVHAALTRSTRLAWFRLPSFEQDERGEGALRQHGLRFSWTHWTGHPTAWLVSDCVNSIKSWQAQNTSRVLEIIVKPALYIRDTNYHRVIPVDSPIDSDDYQPSFGPKPRRVVFNPPLVAEWEVIARFQCK